MKLSKLTLEVLSIVILKNYIRKGYINKKRPLTYDFNDICVDTNIRYSEYLPIKDIMQHLYRLNEYYEVNLYKGTYYKENEKIRYRTTSKK